MTSIVYCLIPVVVHLGISTLLATLAPAIPFAEVGLLSEANRAVLTTGFSALIVLPIMVWMMRRDRSSGRVNASECRVLPHVSAMPCVGLHLLALLGGACLSYLGGRVMTWSGIYEHASNAAQESLLAASAPLAFLFLGIVVPMAEECVYRGVFLSRLWITSSANMAIVISAVLFAVGHGNLIQIVYALPMALVLGLLSARGSLSLAIAFHMGANLLTVIMYMYL